MCLCHGHPVSILLNCIPAALSPLSVNGAAGS